MNLEELTDLEKKDLERIRIQKEFGDGNSKGSVLIDEISTDAWLDFRKIARKYFGNKDGQTLAGLIYVFLAIQKDKWVD